MEEKGGRERHWKNKVWCLAQKKKKNQQFRSLNMCLRSVLASFL